MSDKSDRKEVSVEELRTWLEQKRPVTVVDVRSAADRAEWSIPGSLHVDAREALRGNDPEAMAGIDPPADRPVVTVCGRGNTSLLARDVLERRGFKAFSLAGGMKAWSLAWNKAEVPVSEKGGVRIIQFRRTGKGCLSYLVGSHGEA